jgi:predicted GH43/DUF377 family glycosyl hydrolase
MHRTIGYSFLLIFLFGCKEAPQVQGLEAILSNKKLEISKTAGWVLDPNQVNLFPSNVISHNGYTYLFYVKEPVTSPLAGSGYSGVIYYAYSRDQGHTWSEQGQVLAKGMAGDFDAGGVSKPSVIKATDNDFFYLYYVGVSATFNNQDDTEYNRTKIGLAKLIFNESDGLIRLALKLNNAGPAVVPSDQNSGMFDAFRVDDPHAINMNGQVWLYYTGYDRWNGTARMGLTVSSDINQGHVKQNNGRALLDGSPSLVQKQEVGILAIFPSSQISWYASDGLHFKKLKSKFPATIPYAAANGDKTEISWGMTLPTGKSDGFGRWELK